VKTHVVKEDPEVKRILESLSALDIDTNVLRWKRPMGCSHCKERGTIGQTVAAEMMMPDEVWCKYIREGNDAEALAYWRLTSDGNLNSDNMDGKTVFEHTLWKALQPTRQVDVRQCQRFDNFPRFVASFDRLKQRRLGLSGSRV
jgi:general secretion pathway protein E